MINHALQKEKYKGEGKGCRWCLGYGIYSIPCRTSYFAPGCEEKEKYNNGYLAEWMLWKNEGSFSSHHIKPPPNRKMDVLPKTFLQIILSAKWLVRHSIIRPPTSSDDLCLLLCNYPSYFRIYGTRCPCVRRVWRLCWVSSTCWPACWSTSSYTSSQAGGSQDNMNRAQCCGSELA